MSFDAELFARSQGQVVSKQEEDQTNSSYEEVVRKAVAELSDDDAIEIAKHLIGRHDQKSHSREQHKTKQAAKAGAKAGVKLGAGTGGALGALQGAFAGAFANALGNSGSGENFARDVITTALLGAGVGALGGALQLGTAGGAIGALAGAQSVEKKPVKKSGETGVSDLHARVNVEKHLMGRHDQDNHARDDHQTGVGAAAGGKAGAAIGGLMGAGTAAIGRGDLKSIITQGGITAILGGLGGMASGAIAGTGTTNANVARARGQGKAVLDTFVPGAYSIGRMLGAGDHKDDISRQRGGASK